MVTLNVLTDLTTVDASDAPPGDATQYLQNSKGLFAFEWVSPNYIFTKMEWDGVYRHTRTRLHTVPAVAGHTVAWSEFFGNTLDDICFMVRGFRSQDDVTVGFIRVDTFDDTGTLDTQDLPCTLSSPKYSGGAFSTKHGAWVTWTPSSFTADGNFATCRINISTIGTVTFGQQEPIPSGHPEPAHADMEIGFYSNVNAHSVPFHNSTAEGAILVEAGYRFDRGNQVDRLITATDQTIQIADLSGLDDIVHPDITEPTLPSGSTWAEPSSRTEVDNAYVFAATDQGILLLATLRKKRLATSEVGTLSSRTGASQPGYLTVDPNGQIVQSWIDPFTSNSLHILPGVKPEAGSRILTLHPATFGNVIADVDLQTLGDVELNTGPMGDRTMVYMIPMTPPTMQPSTPNLALTVMMVDGMQGQYAIAYELDGPPIPDEDPPKGRGRQRSGLFGNYSRHGAISSGETGSTASRLL